MENNANTLFVAASRLQLRFSTSKGSLSVDDLWSLSLKSLDALAIGIDAALKPSQTSFLENPDTKQDLAVQADTLRLEILKVVIAIKQDENKAKLAESTKQSQREFLLKLRDKKKLEALEGLTAEEIEAQLVALG